MNTIYEPLDTGAIANCRNTFNANYLTDPQFEMFVSFCTILNREIHKSGSFIEMLENLKFVASKAERFISADKAEAVMRDLFKGVFATTMNDLREALSKNLDELTDEQRSLAYEFAKTTLTMVETGNKMPFHRAYAHQAAIMATELSITDYAAKQLMSEQFEAQETHEFYDAGKEIEDKFYRPQIEAEKRQRKSKPRFSRNTNYANG